MLTFCSSRASVYKACFLLSINKSYEQSSIKTNEASYIGREKQGITKFMFPANSGVSWQITRKAFIPSSPRMCFQPLPDRFIYTRWEHCWFLLGFFQGRNSQGGLVPRWSGAQKNHRFFIFFLFLFYLVIITGDALRNRLMYEAQR